MEFAVDACESYGYPFANIADFLARRHYAANIMATSDGRPDRRENNDRSGIDRSGQRWLFRLLDSRPGRALLRLGYWLQDRFLHTDLGNGYLIVATRR
jgi:hypothetical protein